MKKFACAVALAFAPTLAAAAEKPDWAFPVTEKEQPAPRIPGDKARTVGNVTVTRAGADDFFNIPNWQNGDRSGAAMELMRAVVQKLDNDDMLAIAAYAASLQP